MKLSRTPSLSTAALRGVFSLSECDFEDLDDFVVESVLRGYSWKRAMRIGKKASVLATMSLVLRMFSFRMNRRISMILMRPVPSLGLLRAVTVNFSQLFCTQMFEQLLELRDNDFVFRQDKGTLVR